MKTMYAKRAEEIFNEINEIAEHMKISIRGLQSIVQNPDFVTEESVYDDYQNFINNFHYVESLFQRKMKKIHDDVESICDAIKE